MTRKALQIERAALAAWQAGTLMWTEAIPLTSARHLADLYVLAYRHGVPISRHLSDEAALPTAWRTPEMWRQHPAWRQHWLRRAGYIDRDGNPVGDLAGAVSDMEGDGGQERIRQLQIASYQRMLDKQREEAVAFSAFIKELRT